MKEVRKASRRQVLKAGAALALATGAGFRPVRAQSGTVNVINGGGNFSLMQVLLLKELKLFEKYDVDAKLLNVADGSKIIAGLVSGDGDLCGGSGFSGLFPAIQKGAKIKILAASNIAPLNIMYATKPDIKSVKDLPGRTVATGALGALLHQQAVAAMMKQKVDYKKVKFVNIGSGADVFRALASGAVDAGVAPIEYRDSAAKYNMHPIPDGEIWKELPLYTNQAMYSSDRAIAEKRRGIVGVMAAYADMFRWVEDQKNKDAFINYYKQAVKKASQDEAVFLQKFLSQPNALATGLVMTDQQINYIQDLNIELGAQKERLPFDKACDMSLAREAVALVEKAAKKG